MSSSIFSRVRVRLKLDSSTLKYDLNDFDVVSAILRLATTFEVKHLRLDILRGLSVAWPKTLSQWEIRETKSTNSMGAYDPRKTLPHPMYARGLKPLLF